MSGRKIPGLVGAVRFTATGDAGPWGELKLRTPAGELVEYDVWRNAEMRTDDAPVYWIFDRDSVPPEKMVIGGSDGTETG